MDKDKNSLYGILLGITPPEEPKKATNSLRLMGILPPEEPKVPLSALMGAPYLPPIDTNYNLLAGLLSPSKQPVVPWLPMPAPEAWKPLPNATPSGINFYWNRSGEMKSFSEPASFDGFFMFPVSGLYVALAPDADGKPRKFRPIYFGQADDIKKRIGRSHEKFASWCSQSGGVGSLYIAYHMMPGSTEQQRVNIEAGLIDYYKPACNITFNAFSDWFGTK